MSYHLRRLRLHGLIERIPTTHRYRVTDTGLHHAMFLTRVHNRLIRSGTAHLTDADPPAPSRYARPPTPTTLPSTNSSNKPASPPEI